MAAPTSRSPSGSPEEWSSARRSVPRAGVTVRRRSGATVAVDTSVSVGALELASPVVAASGTFGHGAEVLHLVDPGRLGALTVKSLAAFEWRGNPAPRLHATAGGGMLNSVGLQGPGVAAWAEQELPALRAAAVPVIVSLWGRSVDDFARAAELLAPHVHACAAVELNVSCPNVEDASRMFAHSPAATGAVVAAVHAADLGRPLLAKLSPNTFEVVDVARAAVDAGADGLTLVNTLLGLGVDVERRRPLLGGVTGGYSGPPIKPVALRVVHEVTRALPGTPVIGTGGVSTGADAVEMMLAGASAVGVGTINFHEPRAVNRIHDELVAWCSERAVPRVRDLVGALTTGGAG
jgi:dihydroorotate dehydrogenase (NAD+) catalytic subunit